MRAAALLICSALVAVQVSSEAADLHSACVLPVPDGGGSTPSRANLTGNIAAVGHGFLDIKPRSGRSSIRVNYNGDTQFYTAFGGDYEPNELAAGQSIAMVLGLQGSRPGLSDGGLSATVLERSRRSTALAGRATAACRRPAVAIAECVLPATCSRSRMTA
jgi:hypothetical protein